MTRSKLFPVLLLPLVLALGCESLDSSKLSLPALSPTAMLGGSKVGTDEALNAELEALDRLVTLTPEHFRDTAKVSGSRSSDEMTVSTEPGFKLKRAGLLSGPVEDNYLVATIDRTSGTVQCQVVTTAVYESEERLDYSTAYFATGAGESGVPATALDSAYLGKGLSEPKKRYAETVEFPVSYELLRRVASAHVQDRGLQWRYSLHSETHPDQPEYEANFVTAEVAGFVSRVEMYRGE